MGEDEDDADEEAGDEEDDEGIDDDDIKELDKLSKQAAKGRGGKKGAKKVLACACSDNAFLDTHSITRARVNRPIPTVRFAIMRDGMCVCSLQPGGQGRQVSDPGIDCRTPACISLHAESTHGGNSSCINFAGYVSDFVVRRLVHASTDASTHLAENVSHAS